MLQSIRGLVLQHIKYLDKKNILKIYTLEHGIQSYSVYISHSKSSKIKPAYIQALNQIEFTADVHRNRDIQNIRDIHVTHIYQSLFSDMAKNCIAVFLNEVLIKCLKEQAANKELFFFLCNKLSQLDVSAKNEANFHLVFLLELSSYLGFQPDAGYTPTRNLFDLQEGIFIDKVPEHPYYTDSETSLYLQKLFIERENYACSAKERSEVLNALLLLYRLHIPNFGELKSLPILKEVLA
jgi:DNA repair protein RecO (recombination protein O)